MSAQSRLNHGPFMGEPYTSVHNERIRADNKHGEYSAERMAWDNPRWLPVVTEELGEVARVINEYDLNNINTPEKCAKLIEELIQVAAMACAWVDALREGE